MSKSSSETEESTECPTCGEDDFASEQGMKAHHKLAHGESISTETVECHRCGEPFGLPKWHRDKADRHFCTEECRAEWLSEENSGEGHPQWDGSAERECEWCGSTYRRWASRVEQRSGRFCSRECYLEWAQNTPREESGLFGPVKRGEESPNWKGGYTQNRGTDWPALRERALKADDYQCQGCGITEDEHRSEHGVGLSVHHIRPVTSFDEPADADTVDNLVPLCRDCHTEWEGIPLRPTTD